MEMGFTSGFAVCNESKQSSINLVEQCPREYPASVCSEGRVTLLVIGFNATSWLCTDPFWQRM